MRVICFFDWPELNVREIFEHVNYSLRDRLSNPLGFYLCVGEKNYRSEDLAALLSKFESATETASVEVYSEVKDTADPEAGWKSYLSCTVRSKYSKSLIIALDERSSSHDLIVSVAAQFASLGSFGYGFSTDYPDAGDGRHYAVGISTSFSSEKEMDEDSRWTMERLVQRGSEKPRNRHLDGYFKNVFEYNFLRDSHLHNLNKVFGRKTLSNQIREFGNGNYLWQPPTSKIPAIKINLEQNGFLI